MKYAALITLLFTYPVFAQGITDSELNTTYKNHLKQASTPQHQKAIKQSQVDWLKFRNSQCALISGTYSEVLSEEQTTEEADCINKFNNERIYFLNNYLR